MNAAAIVLDVRNVTKSFSGFVAVNGVSLALRQGERRALIGPNGAGKTTLFNLLSGRLRVDSGEIRYRDRAIQSLPPHEICRLGLARTFQITSIYQRLTPLQNIQVALFARTGQSRRPFRAAARTEVDAAMAVLGDVGLETVAGRESGLLSYGDQKRLELALALALEPQVLLLDEPTAGMESRTRHDMVDLVRRICTERRLTLLFCEHDMDAVFSIADVITVMHQGQVLAEGSPDAVRRNAEVRAIYLGSRHGSAA
jgi:ABC-type branched-subunit amino acid transport system ATPase component